MPSESLFNNTELTQELLETNYFEDSQRLRAAEIDPKLARDYLKASLAEGTAKAAAELEPLNAILLEAIIKQAERPAIKIQNNSFETPRTEYWRRRLEPHRTTIDTVIKSVGRIELREHPRGLSYVGTGWLVTDDIIVTNRHVAQTFAFQEGRKFTFQTNPFENKTIKVNVDFREEYRIDQEEQFDIVDVLYIEPQQGSDMAFLKVKRSGDTSRSVIALATESVSGESEITVIGYPARDSQRNPIEPAKLYETFEDIYDIKRLQPGEVMSTARLSQNVPVFTHDCSTLGGNSGSVVLDFKTGKAIGLHFGGIFQQENYAVPAAIIQRRLDELLSGRLVIESPNESPIVIFSSPIDLEAVDNETPIQLEDTPCFCPLDDGSLEDLIIEAVPFPAVNTQLPILGTGYYSYSQFRDKQFGLPATIKAIEEIGKAWFENHRTGPVIGIGNISKNGGGPVPPHKSHQTGLDVDF
ncbi:penicillin-insensitive murein endopeptidase [Cyanobium sp. NIES-981]|uniref:penicillin-insensitive murein endopeptidase n=1 Tax=Cyanobium sp. NIES-981 TaxID=1851505 RepID=UPI0007DDCE21|nr:penicillin-insensitive murein endopeptidase [Cyanobium sp. NIES-981]SBO41998.1 V8-like Glu-specific endopeptidase (modular protein) [Cyanobium sp. NIES-981]